MNDLLERLFLSDPLHFKPHNSENYFYWLKDGEHPVKVSRESWLTWTVAGWMLEQMQAIEVPEIVAFEQHGGTRWAAYLCGRGRTINDRVEAGTAPEAVLSAYLFWKEPAEIQTHEITNDAPKTGKE